MIAAIHHNYNIDALTNENGALNESNCSSQGNKSPKKRSHKTIVYKWQLNLLNSLENYKNTDENPEEESQIADTCLDESDDEVTDLNNHWIGFFNDHVNI